MIINHNMAAMNTHRQLGSNNAAAANNIEKLSSGLKINKAGDDAAGLAISEKMRGQIRGLDMAAKNSQDGISLIQTAEGSLNETHDILQRMRELAVQAGNDTNTTNDREEVQKELNSLTSEINRIGNTTEFNTQKLLNGAKSSATKEVAVGGELVAETKASIEVGGVTFTAKAADGAAGNNLSIEIVQGTGNDVTASAAFTGGKLTVTMGTSATGTAVALSATDMAALVADTASGSDALTATVTGTGTTSQSATASQSLAGGKDAVLATVAQEQGASLNFQIGANENQSLTLDIADMRASALGLTTTGQGDKLGVTNGTSNVVSEQALDVSSHEAAAAAVTKIQSAIDQVSGERSKLGATQNRLEHTINNLGTSSENLTAAESRIRDVDMAKEMMDFTKNNILTQAAQAMLSQANQAPQGVLQLLR